MLKTTHDGEVLQEKLGLQILSEIYEDVIRCCCFFFGGGHFFFSSENDYQKSVKSKYFLVFLRSNASAKFYDAMLLFRNWSVYLLRDMCLAI